MATIMGALLSEIDRGKFVFKEQFEDIHLNIEKKLFDILGPVAGHMHTARSRNDQVVTDFKLWVKSSTEYILQDISKVMKALLKKAEKNIATIMPGFTHLKNAQPISFAHYLLAYVEMFNRDKARFNNNLDSLSENPLGVAALTGTSFDIDRLYTAKKLGFTEPTRNSIDSVSDRDYIVDTIYTCSIIMLHLSRFCEDLINWNSAEFN